LRPPNSTDVAQVFLVRGARAALARLDRERRAALNESFRRVGRELMAAADRVCVESNWARRTWPGRRYPQQCYAKTVKYVLDHADIEGMRLVHGVVSHAPHFVPLDHAWVDLPGDIVFDGVVQQFFTQASYSMVMAAVVLDTYSAAETRRLVAIHGHPGCRTAKPQPLRRRARRRGAVRAGLIVSARGQSLGGAVVQASGVRGCDAVDPGCSSPHVLAQHRPKVLFIEHDHVVQALAGGCR
jgi:hypothetical protein